MVVESKDERPKGAKRTGTANESPQELVIKHFLSKQFTSHFATGTILSGPLPDGFYQMVFYADAVGKTWRAVAARKLLMERVTIRPGGGDDEAKDTRQPVKCYLNVDLREIL